MWGPGKTPEQIAAILSELATRQHTAMATRIDVECATAVQQLLPEAKYVHDATQAFARVTPQPHRYNPIARTVTYRHADCKVPKERLPGAVAVVAAGTSDLAVVEEVKAVAELMGCYCFKCDNIGLMWATFSRPFSSIIPSSGSPTVVWLGCTACCPNSIACAAQM